MGIVSINTNVTGEIGINPRRVTIITTDNLATVTTAGYLNTKNLLGSAIYSTDEIVMWYGYASPASPGTFAVFTASINATGIITLVEWSNPGEVVLPVTSGHIAVFSGTTGAIGDDAATAINGGNIQAGLSGTAGTLASFPATAAKGSLKVVAVANTGDTLTTISNAAMGQASVVSIPDPAAATANFVVAPAALVNAKLLQASGTGGLVSDSGVATADVQLKTNIKAATTASIGGAGAGPISVVVAGLTASSVIVAGIKSSSNVVEVSKCIATATGFDITFSADPGASCIVNYVAFIVSQ